MARGLEEKLGLIVMKNCEEQGKKIEETIKKKRNTNEDYIIPISQDRFNNGEGKVMINATVRDKDLYILSDIGNHSITYDMFGYKNHMGPDEHYQDIKRVISAARGQAERITVVMPLLYESRQHRRKGRESLDCALALQELQNLGVKTIVTFDVHDPNIQNAVPTNMSFESFYPTNEILKSFIKNEDFRVGFRSGQEKARNLGLYMQKYCGCIFSEEERYEKQIKKSIEDSKNYVL